MSFLFTTILYQPLLNILVFIYNTVAGHDLGLAIVLLTIGVRLVFSPLSLKAITSQRQLAKLQPKLKELQIKFKDNRQALGEATMALYREYNINPFSGCLPLLIQIPVLLALYRVLRDIFKPETFQYLYSFVAHPTSIQSIAFRFLDLTHRNIALAILAGVLQWLQSWQMSKNQTQPVDTDSAALMMNRQLLYFFPVMVIIISWNLPTGLVIYWITTTLFSIAEQFYAARRFRS